ncbi:hypothetical protein BDQ12DRAFT_445467 [Crucibulum laeve]|uniref:Uncharacterized protein n=1 Tax=Crucibulum laeve TaxID=68775 RepID=A0A5C3LKE5_9AGAR|nr:hypothetical protein BDQ12DRAFT_445467 [Crucibulum laeve]
MATVSSLEILATDYFLAYTSWYFLLSYFLLLILNVLFRLDHERIQHHSIFNHHTFRRRGWSCRHYCRGTPILARLYLYTSTFIILMVYFGDGDTTRKN